MQRKWLRSLKGVVCTHTYPEEEGVLCYPLYWLEEVCIHSGVAMATQQHAALRRQTISWSTQH